MPDSARTRRAVPKMTLPAILARAGVCQGIGLLIVSSSLIGRRIATLAGECSGLPVSPRQWRGAMPRFPGRLASLVGGEVAS
jgi:hypothetical protein